MRAGAPSGALKPRPSRLGPRPGPRPEPFAPGASPRPETFAPGAVRARSEPGSYPGGMSDPERDFAIRPIRPEECAALGELIVTAYRALTTDFSPEALERERAYDAELRDVARRAAVSCVLVAIGEGGEVLGGVTYVDGPDDPYAEELVDGDAGMRMLAVDSASRGRGIGRALTQECLDRARAAGRKRLVLHTGPWMPVAVRLYERMGFRRRPELDFAPGPGIDLIGYSFELERTADPIDRTAS